MLMGVRPEKREANENFNQKKGFFEHIYIYKMNRRQSER